MISMEPRSTSRQINSGWSLRTPFLGPTDAKAARSKRDRPYGQAIDRSFVGEREGDA